MREILRITIGLTISCLIAALIMGTVFTVTDEAKKHNEQMDLRETMLGLLGYSPSRPAPRDLRLFSVYRYVIDDKGSKYIGYMLPEKKNGKETYALLVLDLHGSMKGHYDLAMSPVAALEMSKRDSAITKAIESPETFTYADSFFVAMVGAKRLAYLIPGEFPGFKALISVMLALNPSFVITGLDVLEQEEDPGLGAEIVQDYFKNQFIDRTFGEIKDLNVVKKPLPEAYKRYLERVSQGSGMFTHKQIEEIQRQYGESDIYALTGATITSQEFTRGIKDMVRKFAHRVEMLHRVIAARNIPAVF